MNKNKSIFIKFNNEQDKNIVFNDKWLLKNNGMFTKEYPMPNTPKLIKMANVAIEMCGKLFAIIYNRIVKFDGIQDMEMSQETSHQHMINTTKFLFWVTKNKVQISS